MAGGRAWALPVEGTYLHEEHTRSKGTKFLCGAR